VKRSVATRRAYEFGAFRLDPAQRRIEKQGEAVTLHAKAFDALVYLVEHAGEPVSRRALTEALWPKRVVEENNLTQAISALRRALGEDCIATLAGRGYQFVAEVRTVDVNSSSEAATTTERSNPDIEPPSVTAAPADRATVSDVNPLRTRRALLVAASFAVAAVLAMAVYFSPSRTERAAAAATDGEPVKVLLVLPFETQDPEEQAFADGLTEDLIDRLQVPGLRVMGRGTSFALRDSTLTDAEIAARFGVQYVLDGSVDRDGNRLRARSQLSDATGFSVWAESFDRPIGLASIFDIQDEIVAAIAQELRAPIGLDRAPSRGTEDLGAYDLYMAARLDVRRNDARLALDRINKALDRDGKYVAAWSVKAHLLNYLASFLPADQREAQRGLAQEAADKAVSLAPHDGLSHAARAVVLGTRGDWFGAESAYERALDLGYTDMSSWPLFLLSVGRVARARETLERMREDDPLNEETLSFLMLSQELSGQPNEADDLYEHGQSLFDSWSFGRSMSVWIRLGREGESFSVEDISERFVQVVDPAFEPKERLARLHRAATQPEYADPAAKGYLATFAASLNDTQLASDLLGEAMTEQALLAYLAWLPVFDEVRQAPGFKPLLEKVGLVDYWRKTGWPDVCHAVGPSDFACD
jgi:DNA-binding winged helix-turn-helix (wHTH) protein/TolB-like protein